MDKNKAHVHVDGRGDDEETEYSVSSSSPATHSSPIVSTFHLYSRLFKMSLNLFFAASIYTLLRPCDKHT